MFKGKSKTKLLFSLYIALVLVGYFRTTSVFASNDPIAVVNNLSELMFSLIKAIGIILTGFGIFQLGLWLKSHNPSQRANGLMTVAGGIIITITKEILNLIVVKTEIIMDGILDKIINALNTWKSKLNELCNY